MAAKKKRTPAQIRATKKLVALNKKRAKAGRKSIGRPSQTTKKKPTKRLKRRRAANTKKGYFPNPTYYVAYIPIGTTKYYYAGYSSEKKRAVFDDDIKKALWYRTPTRAKTEAKAMGERT